MNPQRPLRDDVTNLKTRVRALESRTTILGVEQAYDAMATAQVARATSSAVASVLGEQSQGSKKIARVELELEKTKQELAEEVKKRKMLEMKVDMMFQWFKAHQK